MLNGIIKTLLCKSIAKDVVVAGVKTSTKNNDVVKEKLGTTSIDEFMRMDIHEYNQKKKDLSH